MAANNSIILSGIVASVTAGLFNDTYKSTTIKIWTAPTLKTGQSQKTYNELHVRVLGRADNSTSAADRAMELVENQVVLVQGELIKDDNAPSGYLIGADLVTPIGMYDPQGQGIADPMINVFTAAGRLGSDAEIRYTNSGKSIVKFSLACDKLGSDSPTWLNKIEAWDNENIGVHMTKGKTVVIQGKIEPEFWNANDGSVRTGLKFVLNGKTSIRFVGNKRTDDGVAAPSAAPVIPAPTTAPAPTTPAVPAVASPAVAAPVPMTAGVGGGGSVDFDSIPF